MDKKKRIQKLFLTSFLAILISTGVFITGGIFQSAVYADTCEHDWLKVEQVNPTNTEDGNLEYSVCKNCGVLKDAGMSTIANYVIPAKKSAGRYSAEEIESVTFLPISGNTYEEQENDFTGINNEYIFNWALFREGDVLRLELKSGATVDYKYVRSIWSGDYNYFQNIEDPNDKIAYANGYETPQEYIEPGETKEMTVKYKGHPFVVKLHVVPNPVKSISYQVCGDGVIRIQENDPDHGEIEIDEDGFKYFAYYPYAQDGDKMTVEYADGRSIVYTYDASIHHFRDEAGEVDYEVYAGGRWPQHYEHWYAGNTYYCAFGYND